MPIPLTPASEDPGWGPLSWTVLLTASTPHLYMLWFLKEVQPYLFRNFPESRALNVIPLPWLEQLDGSHFPQGSLEQGSALRGRGTQLTSLWFLNNPVPRAQTRQSSHKPCPGLVLTHRPEWH